jgi:hypothetical protein
MGRRKIHRYKVLVGKPEGKKPLGISTRSWQDNIKTDLTETGLDGVICINLAQERDKCRALVNTTMNLQVPENGVEGEIS